VTAGSYLSVTSPSGFGFTTAEDGYTVEVFFKVWAPDQPIMSASSPGAPAGYPPGLTVVVDASGYVVASFIGGSISSAVAPEPITVDDGEWHHAAVSFVGVGGTIVFELIVDGVYVTSSASSASLVRFDELRVGGNGTTSADGQFAHAAVYAPAINWARVAAHAEAGLTSFARETTTDRFSRLCRTAGIPSTMHDVDGTGLSTMCAQPTAGVGLLDLVRQCADAEKGVAYVRSSGVLALAPRSVRYGAEVGLTLDARTQLDEAFTLTTDDALLVNDVTASRPGGATIRVTDNASIEAYDIHDDTVTLYLDSDEQVVSAAEWTVFTASQPQPRCTSVTVDAVQFGATGGDVVALLEADMGTRLSITNLPSDTCADGTLDLFIEGVSVRLEKHGPVFTFTTSPVGASGSVWIIEDPVYGGLETGVCIAF
jgi:hypothetical protein